MIEKNIAIDFSKYFNFLIAYMLFRDTEQRNNSKTIAANRTPLTKSNWFGVSILTRFRIKESNVTTNKHENIKMIEKKLTIESDDLELGNMANCIFETIVSITPL
mgnify:CR=1 FL=1